LGWGPTAGQGGILRKKKKFVFKWGGGRWLGTVSRRRLDKGVRGETLSHDVGLPWSRKSENRRLGPVHLCRECNVPQLKSFQGYRGVKQTHETKKHTGRAKKSSGLGKGGKRQTNWSKVGKKFRKCRQGKTRKKKGRINDGR